MATKRLDDLTDEEVLAQLTAERAERERLVREARENLAKYGTALPPVAGAPASGIVRISPRAKRSIDPKWFRVEKTCPHCGKTKNVGRDFGTVIRRGNEDAAGWCRACRSSTNYHAKPRKAAAGIARRTPKVTDAGPGTPKRRPRRS